MPTNVYIRPHDSAPDQRLIEDLIVEAIQIYGFDMYYLPRYESGMYDQIYGEDPRKYFNSAHIIEMYIKNVEGFEGEGDLISRFGLEIRDQTTFTCAIRRFDELINSNAGLKAMGITRPREGDLIYFDLVRPDLTFPRNKGMFFEIQFVEHESIFYQTGALQVYDLRCEAFVYSNEEFATGVLPIDQAYANGTSTYVFTGNTMPSGIRADNTLIEDEADDVLDLTEDSPFGEFS